ncbi:MAG: two-component system response regulator [Chloroflexi bacterium RBG_16_64_43]|nr:MAG: two-component system response regulator [Chloroflexi bacterium RBG_16_64_43]
MPAVRIVCIEDDPQIIELVRTILGRKGYQVIGAAGGQEGLTLVQAQRPDLILLDLMMPDLDGWEVYRRLKEDPLLAPLPVIVVTARAQDIDRVLGLHVAHVDDYLSKPFTPKQLTESVDRVLARRRATSSG